MKLEVAVSILIQTPKLTVRQAILAAEFTPEEGNNKSMQWKVAPALPGKSINNLLGDVRTITGMWGWTDGGLSRAVVRNSIESLTSTR